MDPFLQSVLTGIQLEQLDDFLFRGKSSWSKTNRIFGGEVMAQSLHASQKTVPQPLVLHSVHAYFVKAGDPRYPIIYRVEEIRNGKSFATRRITANQHEQAIYTSQASYQIVEEGFEHQCPTPIAPPPEELPDDNRNPDNTMSFDAVYTDWPIEFRHVRENNPAAPSRLIWLRTKGEVEGDLPVHQQMLAFASDSYILSTALKPQGLSIADPRLQVATLEHSLWFHRPFQVDEWLLYSLQSPAASNARGLSFGHVFDRSGNLVASTAQQGLLRIRS